MRWSVRDAVSIVVLLVCVPVLFFVMKSEVAPATRIAINTNTPIVVSYDVRLLRHRGTKVCLMQVNTPRGEHMISVPQKACDIAFEAGEGQ